jgi:hypothetical protein
MLAAQLILWFWYVTTLGMLQPLNHHHTCQLCVSSGYVAMGSTGEWLEQIVVCCFAVRGSKGCKAEASRSYCTSLQLAHAWLASRVLLVVSWLFGGLLSKG